MPSPVVSSTIVALLAVGLAACPSGDDDTPIDGAVDHDAAITDAAAPDGPGPIDAMTIDAPLDAPPVPMLNNCTAGTAVNRSAPNASRAITFAGTAYATPCMRVLVGQTVTWSGDFSFHPLRAGAIV